ncbi:hypothetical protein BDZ94DRAFT_1272648 [Collybia nuda]|uniref:Uncharacterized protein n=1 Tax=Collybia nuda TaxID=64659 RepID=A0A9P5XU68_9AGAR|nr:hypothetical protein BDZ94DRAFT_1272648 [Collybia nuda]
MMQRSAAHLYKWQTSKEKRYCPVEVCDLLYLSFIFIAWLFTDVKRGDRVVSDCPIEIDIIL